MPTRFGIVLLLSGLTGCASPEQKMADAAYVARSWTATLHLTSEALRRDAAPRLYGHQVLRAAEEAHNREAQQPEWNRLPAEIRDRWDQALSQLSSSLDEPSRRQSRE